MRFSIWIEITYPLGTPALKTLLKNNKKTIPKHHLAILIILGAVLKNSYLSSKENVETSMKWAPIPKVTAIYLHLFIQFAFLFLSIVSNSDVATCYVIEIQFQLNLLKFNCLVIPETRTIVYVSCFMTFQKFAWGTPKKSEEEWFLGFFAVSIVPDVVSGIQYAKYGIFKEIVVGVDFSNGDIKTRMNQFCGRFRILRVITTYRIASPALKTLLKTTKTTISMHHFDYSSQHSHVYIFRLKANVNI